MVHKNNAVRAEIKSPRKAALAIGVGMGVAAVCMAGWAILLVLTRVNYSFLAIIVAALIGWSMGRAGGLNDRRFALLAAVFTLAACHFGAGIAARVLEARQLGYSALELIYGASPGDIFMAVSINVCDLAFYSLAACLAWRQVCPPEVEVQSEEAPRLSRGRIGQVL